jgi:hypothetical protein
MNKQLKLGVVNRSAPFSSENILKLQFDGINNSLSHEHFNNNLNRCFVETGTFHGHGVMSALMKGCKDIHSIEIDKELFVRNLRLFQDGLTYLNHKEFEIETYCRKDFVSISIDGEIRISLYRGDSCRILPMVLARIDEKATFWLDAHHSNGPTGYSEESGQFPIYGELSAIMEHTIKDHTIMIDDIDDFEKFYPGELPKLKSMIRSINKDYVISDRTRLSSKHNDQYLLAKVN